mmetsp:Transcript_14285/g.32480  ORF Transcript_14285/g.32480 Transcript_14285/m.32480 type:complete len:301 (+) Transcript_14285:721-1623(+)
MINTASRIGDRTKGDRRQVQSYMNADAKQNYADPPSAGFPSSSNPRYARSSFSSLSFPFGMLQLDPLLSSAACPLCNHSNIPRSRLRTHSYPSALSTIKAINESTPRLQYTSTGWDKSSNSGIRSEMLKSLASACTACTAPGTSITCVSAGPSSPFKTLSGMLTAPGIRSRSANSSAGRTSIMIGRRLVINSWHFGPAIVESGLLFARRIIRCRAFASAGSITLPPSGNSSGQYFVTLVAYLNTLSQNITTHTTPGSSGITFKAPTKFIPLDGPAMMDSSALSRRHMSNASWFVTSLSSS